MLLPNSTSGATNCAQIFAGWLRLLSLCQALCTTCSRAHLVGVVCAALPMDASRKRARAGDAPDGGADESYGAAAPTFAPSSATPLRTAEGSSSGVAAPRPSCSLPSHGKLEQLLRQTELLRRLDADAHEVGRAELEDQIAGLRDDVEGLTRALQAATMAAAAPAQPPHTAPASAGASAAAVPPELTALREENATLRREAAHAAATAAERDAMHGRAIAHLESEVAAAVAAAARAASAAVPKPSPVLDSGGAHGSGGAAAAPSSAGEREALNLREQLRAAQRAQRAAVAELQQSSSVRATEELLRTQIEALETKAARLEAAASVGGTARGVIGALLRVLARYDAAAREVAATLSSTTGGGGGGAEEASRGGGRNASAVTITTAPAACTAGPGSVGVPPASSALSALTPAVIDALLAPPPPSTSHASQSGEGGQAPPQVPPSAVAARTAVAAAADACVAQADGLVASARYAAASQQAMATTVADLSAKLRAAAAARAAYEAAAAAAREDAFAARTAAVEAGARRTAAERGLAVLAANAASLESLLKTYEAEERVMAVRGGLSGTSQQQSQQQSQPQQQQRPPRGASAPATALFARVTALEKSLAEVTAVNAGLTRELAAVGAEATAAVAAATTASTSTGGGGEGAGSTTSSSSSSSSIISGGVSTVGGAGSTTPPSLPAPWLCAALFEAYQARLRSLQAEITLLRGEAAILYDHTPIAAVHAATSVARHLLGRPVKLQQQQQQGQSMQASGGGGGGGEPGEIAIESMLAYGAYHYDSAADSGATSSSDQTGASSSGVAASSLISAYDGGATGVPSVAAFDPSLALIDVDTEEREGGSCSISTTTASASGEATASIELGRSTAVGSVRVLHCVLNPTSAALRAHDR